jgi:hypothetical protein
LLVFVFAFAIAPAGVRAMSQSSVAHLLFFVLHPSIGYCMVHATRLCSTFEYCGVYILVASRRASHAFSDLPPRQPDGQTDRQNTYVIHLLSIASVGSEMNHICQSNVEAWWRGGVEEQRCEPSSTWQASTAPIVIEPSTLSLAVRRTK